MPVYEFYCLNCHVRYDDFIKYDPKGKYAKVKCPDCKSKKKDRIMSSCYIMNTESQNNIFEIKAGKNMEKAKEERRQAEKASHMGTAPFTFGGDTDINTFGEGIHNPEFRRGLS